MDNRSEYIEDIRVIKKVMEESSRFLSLSGLAGVFAGLSAIAGVVAAVIIFLDGHLRISDTFFQSLGSGDKDQLVMKLALLAGSVLLVSITLSLWLSYRKSVRKGLSMWTPVSKRFLTNLLVPLFTGGILILIFITGRQFFLVLPSMLIFYGLSLVSATKFTYSDIFYLGLLEIILGLFAAAIPSMALVFWAAGFGVLHIIYGIVMYRKYER
jgi:hypothetical protein